VRDENGMAYIYAKNLPMPCGHRAL